jgi:hypothetical protein
MLSARPLLLLILVSAAFVPCRGEPTPQPLHNGPQAPSPDGKLIVYYDAPKVEIRNAQTSAVQGTAEATSPVYALLWTSDSKTLIVVEHMAHGSDAFFVHFRRGLWQQFDANPLEGEDYRGLGVVDVRPHQKTVNVSYKTYLPTTLVSFTVIPSTRKVTDLRRRGISFQRWQQMLLFPLRHASASNQSLEPTTGRCEVHV